MSYTPKTWTTGDTITVADLLHLDSQYAAIETDLTTHVAAGHPAVYRPKTNMDSYFWHAGNDGSGSGLNADTLSGQHAATISGGVASGIMFWWNPQNGAVPAGYYFCDGSNGTYDMRLKFPIGSSGTLAVGSTVGNVSIQPEGTVSVTATALTVANIFHAHTLLDVRGGTYQHDGFDSGAAQCRRSIVDEGSITDWQGSGNAHTHDGTFWVPEDWAFPLDPIFKYLTIIQKS